MRDHRQDQEWNPNDMKDLGDRLLFPDPGRVLLVLTVIGVIGVAVCLALSGCVPKWHCKPTVSVNMAPPTPGKDPVTSYGFGMHCEQEGGQ